MKKTIMVEKEVEVCDFCGKDASENCWGHACRICGKDLCDEHSVKPVGDSSFIVCPECSKLDLSDIIKVKSDIGKLFNMYKDAERELVHICVKLKETYYAGL